MWKWVLGAIGVVVVLLVGGMCYGMRKLSGLASGSGVTTTMIGASPARVFASLAHGDSIPDWMVMGVVSASRHGILRAGDTVHVRQPETAQQMRRVNWTVTEVAPGRSFEIQLRNDSANAVMLVRRYAVEARGDSTALTSSVTSPIADSVNAPSADASTERAMVGITAKLMLGAMRMQTQFEVQQLKNRIEGRPVLAPGRPPQP